MHRTHSVWLPALILLVSAGGCESLYLFGSLLSPEWASYQAALREYEQRVASLPSVAVQVVNQAAVAVEVTLVAGMEEPDPPVTISEMPPYFVPNTSPSVDMMPVDTQTVAVPAGATETLAIKCGEVIGVSVTTPDDSEDAPLISVVGQFGLSIFAGNVELSGLGTTGEANLGRFIRPSEDNLDCTAQTLVLAIEATDNEAVTGTVTAAD